MWVETLLYNVGKSIAGIGEKSPETYADATANAEALYLVCVELEKRNNESGL